MAARASRSGNGSSMIRDRRPPRSNAGSRASGRFVGGGEGLLDQARPLPLRAGGQVGGVDGDQVAPELAGDRSGEERLAASGWTVQQDPAPRDPVLLGSFGMVEQQPDGSPHLRLQRFEAADVGERRQPSSGHGGQARARGDGHRCRGRRTGWKRLAPARSSDDDPHHEGDGADDDRGHAALVPRPGQRCTADDPVIPIGTSLPNRQTPSRLILGAAVGGWQPRRHGR